MSLHAHEVAHANGFDENMFLDPSTRTYVRGDRRCKLPVCNKGWQGCYSKSDSILPSITRRSLVYVAEHYLGLKVTQRPVKLSELGDFAECGLCGTAAVISPVGKGSRPRQREICFPSGMDEMGPVIEAV